MKKHIWKNINTTRKEVETYWKHEIGDFLGTMTAEVGKVNLNSNGDEALNDESP